MGSACTTPTAEVAGVDIDISSPITTNDQEKEEDKTDSKHKGNCQ